MSNVLFEVLCAPQPQCECCPEAKPGRGTLVGCGGPAKCGSGCPKKRRPCPDKKERFVVAVSGWRAQNTECSPYRAPDDGRVLCIDLMNAHGATLWVADLPHQQARRFCRAQANLPPGEEDVPAEPGLLVEVRNCSGRDIDAIDLYADGVIDEVPLPCGESRWFTTVSPIEDTRFL